MNGCVSGTASSKAGRLRMPVIAAINGHALGGGLELAAAADLRVAERHVRIGMPETVLGMVPGWSGTQRLVRRFGAQIVRRMVLGGETFTAAEACGTGSSTRSSTPDREWGPRRRTRRAICGRGPAALEICQADAWRGRRRGQRHGGRGAGLDPGRHDRGSAGRGRRLHGQAARQVQGIVVMTVLEKPSAIAGLKVRNQAPQGRADACAPVRYG